MRDEDEFAKRFDNFMYGLMLSSIEEMPSFRRAKSELCKTAEALENKVSIPQIRAALPDIKEINTDAYWEANNILMFEHTRVVLRSLIKFLADDVRPKAKYVRLDDPVMEVREGDLLEAAVRQAGKLYKAV